MGTKANELSLLVHVGKQISFQLQTDDFDSL